MGGETDAVLVYGPSVKKSVIEWSFIFGSATPSEDEEDPDPSLWDALWEFLKKHGMVYVFENNVDSTQALVGAKVASYDTFGDTERQHVKEFCWNHGLPPPTFYAGLII